MDQLRNDIWDFLYNTTQPQSLEAIAAQLNCDLQAIDQAVDHEWFDVSNREVSIAYAPQSDETKTNDFGAE